MYEIAFTPTLVLPPQGGGDWVGKSLPQGGGDEISIFLPQGRRLGWGNPCLKGEEIEKV